MNAQFQFGLQKAGQETASTADLAEKSRERARQILGDMNPVQRKFALDPNPLVAGLCPRRAGKSYAACGTALAIGEANPGSVVLLISLNLKMTKRNYWQGSRSGLHHLSKKYGLNLDFNTQDLRWTHENGSIGYLMGCDTRESMENMRGMEADLYIVDECKSFSPSVLEELIDDVLMPQRISRDGRVMLIGTPGSVLAGPFWQATNILARDPQGLPWARLAGTTDAEVLRGRDPRNLWSLHTWTMQDNVAKPEQWAGALLEKARKGWRDDHPTWRREYLGEWISTSDGLVFKYADVRNEDPAMCSWQPVRTKDNPTGLPQDKGPWRFVWGLDLGFEDPTALVICAYSESEAELRHVWSIKKPHMLLDDIEDMLIEAERRFGKPDRIFADKAGLGKLLVETLVSHGFPIEPAIKSDKNDGIELLNADFAAGRIKIIPNTDLEDQLLTVGWDLSKGARDELAKSGKLKEDSLIPNDVTDAFIYLHRGCYHLFSQKQTVGPPMGTQDWWEMWERDQVAAARKDYQREARRQDGLPRGPGRDDLKVGRRTFNTAALERLHANIARKN